MYLSIMRKNVATFAVVVVIRAIRTESLNSSKCIPEHTTTEIMIINQKTLNPKIILPYISLDNLFCLMDLSSSSKIGFVALRSVLSFVMLKYLTVLGV